MDERARRVGQNEALYRSINERIEELNRGFGAFTGTMTIVCECGDASCTEQIEVPVEAYERVRADPTHFVILPGHEIADVEDVVEEADAYHVVAKRPGEPAELAREIDPRSG